jgi:uncharacterized protein (TIGR03118 family)
MAHERREFEQLTRNLVNAVKLSAETTTVTQTNLVSDGAIPAAVIDPNLINPWGISMSATSPFWVSDNGAGVATLYNGTGTPLAAAGHAAIMIPAAGGDGSGTPTGQVFNIAGSGFNVSANGVTASSAFLFATEDGTISGWSPTVNPGSAVIAVNNSTEGAVYKGLALGTVNGAPRLYAADFANNRVDMFDSQFNRLGSFTDSSLPTGYAPFNVQNLNGRIFVTFAQQNDAKHDDVPGVGHGFVDEFDTSGKLLAHVASNGPLDSPWGLDIAPPSFGPLAGDLLVGNFGNGTIDAYDLRTDMLAAVLKTADGAPLKIDGLWALTNGNGFTGGDPNTVYFTAGPNGEADGLFGSLTPSVTTHFSPLGNLLSNVSSSHLFG